MCDFLKNTNFWEIFQDHPSEIRQRFWDFFSYDITTFQSIFIAQTSIVESYLKTSFLDFFLIFYLSLKKWFSSPYVKLHRLLKNHLLFNIITLAKKRKKWKQKISHLDHFTPERAEESRRASSDQQPIKNTVKMTI